MKDMRRVDPVSSARPITFSDQLKTNRPIDYRTRAFYKHAKDMGFKQGRQEEKTKKEPEQELVKSREKGKGCKFDAYV